MDPSGKGHSLQVGQRYPQDVKALPRQTGLSAHFWLRNISQEHYIEA